MRTVFQPALAGTDPARSRHRPGVGGRALCCSHTRLPSFQKPAEAHSSQPPHLHSGITEVALGDERQGECSRRAGAPSIPKRHQSADPPLCLCQTVRFKIQQGSNRREHGLESRLECTCHSRRQGAGTISFPTQKGLRSRQRQEVTLRKPGQGVQEADQPEKPQGGAWPGFRP